MNLRLLAMTGAVVVSVALRLTVASAGPVGHGAGNSAAASEPAAARPSEAAADKPSGVDGERSEADDRLSGADEPSEKQLAPRRSPLALDLGFTTTARCGPELASPGGIEAQTCVLTQERDTWARTYYRNATGDGLSSVLTLMGPGGRTVQMHCAAAADDEPAVCETPRERTTGDARAYTAVAEFAESGGGPLLLRSGSNSPGGSG
ncbi:hypothetical protein FE633_45905 [Streptomyces montanus]|uniref:Serine/threonine protein kinase n=1 Tax=Streptomyces montanus TaxID=2580423 RepID=A0A5R9FD95_9ACTN|nr:hypothetical protein [Streptomyces montanus]TLS39628.1 hypothetical protein FE633_45905 [Streptomyces montanus]